MIFRFLLGALTGTVFVVVSLVFGSAIFPVKAPTEVSGESTAEATAETVVSDEAQPVESEVAAEPVEAAAEPVAVEETATVAVDAPETAEPQPMVTEAVPEVATATESTASEDTATDATAIAAEVAEPETPQTPDAPAAPSQDDAQAATVEPASVDPEPAPEAAETASAEEVTPAVEPEAAPVDVALADAGDLSVAPTDPAPTEAEATTETTTEAQPDVVAEAVTIEPTPEADNAADDVAAGAPVADEASEAVVEPAAVVEPETEVAAETQGTTFAPAPGFVTGEAPSNFVDQEETAETDPAAEAPVDDRPIAKFATAFDNPEAKPVLAIVLVDPGTADLDRAALAALPFPVSFALDPMDPATPDHAAIYRAAGREVIMLATGIAEGSEASDVEVAFQAMTQRLPEAVAVMDLAEAVFQDNRPLASLVVPVIGADGRGVLSWDKGLNAADQVARRDDIASAVIFRDLATGGGDASATKRTLDRAVFKAGQDGRVVVAGMVTPELLSGLLEWSVEGRAGAVALAPLTAALQID